MGKEKPCIYQIDYHDLLLVFLLVDDHLNGNGISLAGFSLDEVAGWVPLDLDCAAVLRHSSRSHVWSNEIEACSDMITLMFVL